LVTLSHRFQESFNLKTKQRILRLRLKGTEYNHLNNNNISDSKQRRRIIENRHEPAISTIMENTSTREGDGVVRI
jgi:hypothetical protein